AAQSHHATQSATLLLREQGIELTFDKQSSQMARQALGIVQATPTATGNLRVFGWPSRTANFDCPERFAHEPGDGDAAGNIELSKPAPLRIMSWHESELCLRDGVMG